MEGYGISCQELYVQPRQLQLTTPVLFDMAMFLRHLGENFDVYTESNVVPQNNNIIIQCSIQ